MNPKISIIIPTYNRAALVCDTIESVFAQSFQNYEILVIDDGSTDETCKVLETFSENPNFRYYFQENKGRSTARNFGMEKAAGEYLMFLDSDDLLLPDSLQTLYDIANKNPDSGVIGGQGKYVDEKGKILASQGSFELKREVFSEKLHIEKIRQFFFSQGTYIIKKSLALSLNGFKTDMHVGEDLDFFLRYCDADKVSFAPVTVMYIRKHNSNTHEQLVTEAIRNIAKENFDFLNENPNHFPPKLMKAMKAEWQIRLAEDFYVLGDNAEALTHYLTAIRIAPELLLKPAILKRTLMTIIPHRSTELAKKFIRRN